MTLVNLAEIAWSLERRRNAAMFVNLLRSAAPFGRGIFVDPPLHSSRATAFSQRAREGLLALRPRDSGEGFLWYRPSFFVPFHGRPLVFRSMVALFAAALGRALRGQDYCLWINNIEPGPFAVALALAKGARKVVLDLSDDWTTFRDLDPAARDRRLQAALAMADVVIAVNEHVLAKFPHRSGRVFPNATDFGNFQGYDPHYRLGDVLPRRPGRRIVGFVGGLHVGRVDEVLLHRLIEATPDATFLFVGYSNSEELLARLRAHGNVVAHPAVPYRELPNVIRAFDVAIVPHLVNEYTRGNDLLKVLDYLACGVPCVSTDCSNVRKYGSALYVADSPETFVATVRSLLDGQPHDPQPGLEAARAASWERTVPELAQWLATALA